MMPNATTPQLSKRLLLFCKVSSSGSIFCKDALSLSEPTTPRTNTCKRRMLINSPLGRSAG
eukprot:scaffold581_cov453-Pavlova_lutheri.AAC.2